MKAEELHKNSEIAREQDRHIDALKLIEEALVKYQKEKNYEGFAKALQSRVLIYKHLFLLSADEVFAILAQKDAEASLEVTQEHNLTNILCSCYFRIGEIASILDDYPKAIDSYQKSLDLYEGTKAEEGDYRYHLGTVLYMGGEKEKGKKTMLQGLKEIQNNRNQVDSFVANVWESGCYMRLAEVLWKDEPGEAKRYLKLAEKIIKSDKRLIIRKRQWQKLASSFK